MKIMIDGKEVKCESLDIIFDFEDEDGDKELKIHPTDEGLVYDVFEKDGGEVIRTGYQFVDDIVELTSTCEAVCERCEKPCAYHPEVCLCEDCAKDTLPEQTPEPFDYVAFTIAYESDELSEEEVIDGFQRLIDSGLVWSLQGNYGRTALQLIEDGHCHHQGTYPNTIERNHCINPDSLIEPPSGPK